MKPAPRDEDLEKVLATAKARKNVDKYAYLASFDEIKENDFNLNIPRYVDTFEEEEEIDLEAVLRGRKALKADLEAWRRDGRIPEGLGYGA